MAGHVPRLIEALALCTILRERLQIVDPRLVPADLLDSLDEVCERLDAELSRETGTFATSTS